MAVKEATKVDVRHVVRRISAEGQPGTISANEANNYIASFLDDGYKLEHVSSMGTEPGTLNVFYLLIKYA